MRSLVALVSALVLLLAAAHDGHGQSGMHVHATDAFGYLALAGVAAAALLFARRK